MKECLRLAGETPAGHQRGGPTVLYVGLDLSRKRLDWHALAVDGERLGAGACPPDRVKRLLVRYERRADIHHALLALGCCLVCFRRLRSSI
jgi:hypothetical protein